MNILKSVAFLLLLAAGLSSCIVAAPGYGHRRGPGFYRGHGHHHHGGGYNNGGGRVHNNGGGRGHYRR